jgi:hypothetical protein
MKSNLSIALIILLSATITSAAPLCHRHTRGGTITLKIAKADDVANILKVVFKGTPGLTVVANTKVNSVAIRASRAVLREVRELIRKIEDVSAMERNGGPWPKTLPSPRRGTGAAVTPEIR